MKFYFYIISTVLCVTQIPLYAMQWQSRIHKESTSLSLTGTPKEGRRKKQSGSLRLSEQLAGFFKLPTQKKQSPEQQKRALLVRINSESDLTLEDEIPKSPKLHQTSPTLPVINTTHASSPPSTIGRAQDVVVSVHRKKKTVSTSLSIESTTHTTPPRERTFSCPPKSPHESTSPRSPKKKKIPIPSKTKNSLLLRVKSEGSLVDKKINTSQTSKQKKKSFLLSTLTDSTTGGSLRLKLKNAHPGIPSFTKKSPHTNKVRGVYQQRSLLSPRSMDAIKLSLLGKIPMQQDKATIHATIQSIKNNKCEGALTTIDSALKQIKTMQEKHGLAEFFDAENEELHELKKDYEKRYSEQEITTLCKKLDNEYKDQKLVKIELAITKMRDHESTYECKNRYYNERKNLNAQWHEIMLNMFNTHVLPTAIKHNNTDYLACFVIQLKNAQSTIRATQPIINTTASFFTDFLLSLHAEKIRAVQEGNTTPPNHIDLLMHHHHTQFIEIFAKQKNYICPPRLLSFLLHVHSKNPTNTHTADQLKALCHAAQNHHNQNNEGIKNPYNLIATYAKKTQSCVSMIEQLCMHKMGIEMRKMNYLATECLLINPDGQLIHKLHAFLKSSHDAAATKDRQNLCNKHLKTLEKIKKKPPKPLDLSSYWQVPSFNAIVSKDTDNDDWYSFLPDKKDTE